LSLNISNSAYLNNLNRSQIKVDDSTKPESLKSVSRLYEKITVQKLSQGTIETSAEKPVTDPYQQQPKLELSPNQSERLVHLYRSNSESENSSSSAISEYLKTENIDQQDVLKSSLVGLDIYV
jgi:hypothetical protein